MMMVMSKQFFYTFVFYKKLAAFVAGIFVGAVFFGMAAWWWMIIGAAFYLAFNVFLSSSVNFKKFDPTKSNVKNPTIDQPVE